MRYTVASVLNTLYVIFFIIAIILISIDGNHHLELGGWARIGINIIVFILFSLTINQYLAIKNRLDTEYYQLQIDCLNSKVASKNLFERIFSYYNQGGDKVLSVEQGDVEGMQWVDCNNFKVNLNFTHFYADKNIDFFQIKIEDFQFKGNLIEVTFINHTFHNVSFDAHCWGLIFDGCTFQNVDFSKADRVVTCQFNVLQGNVEGLIFYNTSVSSCNIISLSPPEFREYEEGEAHSEFLKEYKEANIQHINGWRGRFEFNSRTRLTDFRISFDIYLAIKDDIYDLIENVHTDCYSLAIIVNPTNKSLPTHVP